jgi:site-specific DNA-cytosine methylase
MGYDYLQVEKWMRAHGYEREAEKCIRRDAKLKAGGQIMRRGTIVPKDYIGAFVAQYPLMLTHHEQDRYVTYREALTIMGMPKDFELLDPKKSFNHICQSVPVDTAADMAFEVKEYLMGRRKTVDNLMIFQYNGSREVKPVGGSSRSLESFMEFA